MAEQSDASSATAAAPAPNVFDLLSNPKRMAIVRALGDHAVEYPDDRALRFSTLRERAGIEDKGNFNYHLDRLLGRLVGKDEDGYHLSMPGLRVHGALRSGAYDLAFEWGPEPIDGRCGWCEGSLDTAVYEEGVLWTECEAGHRGTLAVPPAILAERDGSDWTERVAAHTTHTYGLMMDGICPLCAGRMEPTVEQAKGRWHYTGQCEQCGIRTDSGVGRAVLRRPVVRRFLEERDVDPVRTPDWKFEFTAGHAPTQVSEDPLQLELEVQAGGDTLVVTVDEFAAVVDSEVRSA